MREELKKRQSMGKSRGDREANQHVEGHCIEHQSRAATKEGGSTPALQPCKAWSYVCRSGIDDDPVRRQSARAFPQWD